VHLLSFTAKEDLRMPNAKDLLSVKGWGGVVTVNPDATIHDAARVMNERRVGSLLVIENDAVAGILTEKDVVYRVVALAKDPATIKVREAMTKDVICVQPDRPLEEIEGIMRQERVRHVPVVDGKALLGVLSIGDVTAWHATKSAQEVEHLTAYIRGW
jgi:CBS domain-containing protein